MIAAANVAPNFLLRQQITAEDLRRLQEPCVLFEYEGADSDLVPFYVYTVGGYLDGKRLTDGCTVSGQVIVIHADSRHEADWIACQGLMDSVNLLDDEEARYQQAHAALARLGSISPVERMTQATKPDSDKSDAFREDVLAVRPLIGDDVILAAGQVEKPTEH